MVKLNSRRLGAQLHQDQDLPIDVGAIAFKKTLYGFYTFRYQWEVAAHTTTQGRGMNMMLEFPLKPIKIP